MKQVFWYVKQAVLNYLGLVVLASSIISINHNISLHYIVKNTRKWYKFCRRSIIKFLYIKSGVTGLKVRKEEYRQS